MPRLLLVVTALLAVLGLFGLSKLRNEDDVMVFLPEGEKEVSTFKEVAQRFGAMRVALIGIKPKIDGCEVFTANMLGRITRLSETLKNTQGVDRVVSLATMTDLHPGEGGVDIRPLLPSPLPSQPALALLKAHALTLPQVRGSIISSDGRAALLMVFLSEGGKVQALAEKARVLALAEFADVADVYFGGAPFAGQSIYEDTQRDVRRLTPLALLLFLLIVLLAFRGVLPVVLTVATVALSGVLVLGGMGFWGESFTVVTGTLPLILFAAGSQYAIHILGRYYLLRQAQKQSGGSPLSAAVGAIRIAGMPVTVAALNCCLGFLSFAVMNIRAMRTFGYACSFGVMFCLLFALTVLPAVVARWEPASAANEKPASFAALGQTLLRGFRLARRGRLWVITACLLLAVLCGGGMTQVTVRMEPRAFFRPGSEPEQAQRFLDHTFGGSQFIQVLVEGDLTDPRALAEVRRLGAFARSLPEVTQVQSIVEPLALVSEAMAGQKGLPASRAQVGTLLFFVEGEPSLRALLTADRKAALLHIRLLGEAAPVLHALETYFTQRWPFVLRPHQAAELAEELSWLLPQSERAARLPALLAAVKSVQDQGLGLGGPAAAAANAEANTAENGAENFDASEQAAAAEMVRGRAAQQAAIALLQTALESKVSTEALTLTAVAALQPPIEPAAVGAAPEVLRGRLTGEPMLDRGFSRAVEHNQWASLAVTLVAVLLTLIVAQRSLWLAVLSLLPAILALLVVFGTLGLCGQPIDLGTSLVGSIVTSSGADFAMHYIWYLRRRSPEEVVPTVGPVIFTTAVLLGMGMGVLMLGGAPPIRLFGGLASAGMVISAAFTFLLVPALLPIRNNLKKESV